MVSFRFWEGFLAKGVSCVEFRVGIGEILPKCFISQGSLLDQRASWGVQVTAISADQISVISAPPVHLKSALELANQNVSGPFPNRDTQNRHESRFEFSPNLRNMGQKSKTIYGEHILEGQRE